MLFCTVSFKASGIARLVAETRIATVSDIIPKSSLPHSDISYLALPRTCTSSWKCGLLTLSFPVSVSKHA